MKLITNKTKFLKEYKGLHSTFGHSCGLDFIDPIIISKIKENLHTYRELASIERNSIKLKYFYDRIKNYEEYLNYVKFNIKKNQFTKPYLAFYSSTPNLVNNANYLLRIKYAQNIFRDDSTPLIFFLEDPIFHLKQESKIMIAKEKIVLNFKGNNFFTMKKDQFIWNKKLKQKLGSYIELLNLENKEWLKERYSAVLDLIFNLITKSYSYAEFLQKLAIDCLILEGFHGIISFQLDLIYLIQRNIGWDNLIQDDKNDDKNIEIDIVECPKCKNFHEGSFKIEANNIINTPCGSIEKFTFLNSKIRLKRALLPFLALHYLNIIPILSKHSYVRYFKDIETKFGLDKTKICFILNKINYLSLFSASMGYVNLLSESVAKEISTRIGLWQNKKNITIKNSDFYVMKNKKFDFVPTGKLKVSSKIISILRKREKARRRKNWNEADKLRKELIFKGIETKEDNCQTLIRQIA